MQTAIHAWMSANVHLTGAIEDYQVTTTARVLRAPTSEGFVYFKAPIPVYQHEAAVTAQLAAWFPEHLPEVIAADPERNWLLTKDAGRSIRDRVKANEPVPPIDTLIASFAELQQRAAERVEPMLLLGIPDRRLQELPTLYENLLADTDAMLIDREEGMTREQYQRLLAFQPEVERLCRQLGNYTIPQTLHHDDFHMGNMLFQNGEYRFVDWGESCIAHPFYSLVIVLRYAKFVMKWDEAQLQDIQRSYLSAWLAYEPMSRLEEAFALAAQLAALCRALTWYQIAKGVPDENRAEYADGAPYWLLVFLHNSPLELEIPQAQV